MQAETRSTVLARLLIDLPVTLAAWGYYIFAFLLFFAPFYAGAFFCPHRRQAFQWLNHLYCRGLFGLLRLIAPRQHWQIDARLEGSKGAVVLCNHLSYLDPLLLMAKMRTCTTVVKARFFLLPIFGWVLKSAGYLPSSTEGRFSGLMLKQMEGLQVYLAEGGNLFIFPEGTRSRSGEPAVLQRGALKLARLTKAPLAVFRLDNTHILFPPGRFLFNASRRNTIRISYVASILPEDALYQGPVTQLEKHLSALLTGTNY
ncbi:MAG: 1-acyl-sn-glycerol-3-phosphate acyltransferase [Desulfobulbaceae bacterium]|nr:1-acyl-sn-glycerol-3-phosphate acyltransferase [Desulfobulbaceae bacterium]